MFSYLLNVAKQISTSNRSQDLKLGLQNQGQFLLLATDGKGEAMSGGGGTTQEQSFQYTINQLPHSNWTYSWIQLLASEGNGGVYLIIPRGKESLDYI